MPKFALANVLYYGQIPSHFADVTWVKEMVCACHRYTAHITQVFQSNDPSSPKVLHRNMCMHEMNTVSTTTILPWTPADMNNVLSVVFVGPP